MCLAISIVTGGGCAGAHLRRESPGHVQPLPLAESAADDWPMYRDDVQRTGFAEGSIVGTHVATLWSMPAFNTTEYGAAKGSPSIVGGMLYCGTDTGRFVSARVDDGSIVWEVHFDGTTHGVHGSPAIVGDTVYIGAYDGVLRALDRFTGRERWRYAWGDQIGSSPAVVPAWAMVFSAHETVPHGGAIAALDARTGEELWRQPTIANPHSSVAVDVTRERVFVGDNSGTLYAFDARSGRALWRRVFADADRVSIKTTPTVVESLGLVIFGAWSGHVHALDEDTGATRWVRDVGGRIMGSTAYDEARGVVFVGTPRGYLHALEVVDGRERWSYPVGARIVSSPAISGDGRAVVFGAENGRVYAVWASDGRLLWSIAIGGRVSGSPSLVGDRVYVTTHGGALIALRTYDDVSS